MDYIEIKLPKATVYLTAGEINKLLLKDIQLYSEVLKRSKYIKRSMEQKSRESQKQQREEQGFN